MQLFIDSAERALLAPLLETGLFRGVTTNPTLFARAGITLPLLPDFVRWLRDQGAGTIFIQVWGRTRDDYLRSAAQLLDGCGEVVIKVPVTPAGVAAVSALERDGVRTLLTGVYNHIQIVPAIAAGATYVAPYLGRMNDAGMDGIAEIRNMQTVLDRATTTSRLLVASVRTPRELTELAMCGVQDFTISPALWHEMLSEPLTDAAVSVFEHDGRGFRADAPVTGRAHQGPESTSSSRDGEENA